VASYGLNYFAIATLLLVCMTLEKRRKFPTKEDVTLNTFINLWVQEKLQQYAETLPE
jgi:hypothetical protein